MSKIFNGPNIIRTLKKIKHDALDTFHTWFYSLKKFKCYKRFFIKKKKTCIKLEQKYTEI